MYVDESNVAVESAEDEWWTIHRIKQEGISVYVLLKLVARGRVKSKEWPGGDLRFSSADVRRHVRDYPVNTRRKHFGPLLTRAK
jgi:hypothetical protein